MSYRKWTINDLEFIKNNYKSMVDKEIAIKLSNINESSITTAMVRNKRRKLCLNKTRGRPIKHVINKKEDNLTVI